MGRPESAHRIIPPVMLWTSSYWSFRASCPAIMLLWPILHPCGRCAVTIGVSGRVQGLKESEWIPYHDDLGGLVRHSRAKLLDELGVWGHPGIGEEEDRDVYRILDVSRRKLLLSPGWRAREASELDSQKPGRHQRWRAAVGAHLTSTNFQPSVCRSSKASGGSMCPISSPLDAEHERDRPCLGFERLGATRADPAPPSKSTLTGFRTIAEMTAACLPLAKEAIPLPAARLAAKDACLSIAALCDPGSPALRSQRPRDKIAGMAQPGVLRRRWAWPKAGRLDA